MNTTVLEVGYWVTWSMVMLVRHGPARLVSHFEYYVIGTLWAAIAVVLSVVTSPGLFWRIFTGVALAAYAFLAWDHRNDDDDENRKRRKRLRSKLRVKIAGRKLVTVDG